MKFEFPKEITKDFLLSQYSEETYMEYYLGIPVKKGLFKNPLRQDNHPTASFYRSSSQELIFKDFGWNFSGNFVTVVMTKFNCGYYEALNIIAEDFHLKPGSTNKKVVIASNNTFSSSGPSKIQIEEKNFSEDELDWWNQFGITEKILKRFNVHSCKTIFLNGEINAQSGKHCPIYGYYLGKKGDNELWRIYFPKRKSFRFLSNTPAKLIQGYHQLPKKGKLLVITKSMKDTMCLYAYGIPSISPNSENLFIEDKMLNDLKSRFEHIIVFYDQDKPGKANMAKIRRAHPELDFFVIPKEYEAKDFSDLRKMYGYEKTKSLIVETLKHFKTKWLNKH